MTNQPKNGQRRCDNSLLPLRAEAKEYFDQYQLSDKQLAGFSQYLHPTSGNKEKLPALEGKAFRRWLGLAMSVCLLALGWLLYAPSGDISLRIASEVAKNHINMKPLEVQTNQISELRDYFTEIDFSLVKTHQRLFEQRVMLGGRYCSVLGITAAQLRYTDVSSTAKITLYQVGYNPELHGEIPDIGQGQSPQQRHINGVVVNLWRENGLLMAEARYASR